MTPGTVRFENGATVRVDIVSEPTEMAYGLMDRTSLPENAGMLFWFGSREDHVFWMRRTRIPLDLVFVDRDLRAARGPLFGVVVGVLTLEPLDERQHSIKRPSTCVLEVNGGWTARHGVAVGQKVTVSAD
jgi:uncharacterized membrane protein (UPF0127 family)